MFKKIIGFIIAFLGAIATGFIIGARSGRLSYGERISRDNDFDREFGNREREIERRLKSGLKRTNSFETDLSRIKEILDRARQRTKTTKYNK